MMATSSLLVARDIVMTTNSSATSDGIVGIMTTLSFQYVSYDPRNENIKRKVPLDITPSAAPIEWMTKSQ